MDEARFNEITSTYPKLRVAVFGDFCLDRYLEIDPEREEVSIETGLAAHQVVRVRPQPGGAGTVLNNVVALGPGMVWAIGFCGEDGEGYELRRALQAQGVQTEHFLQTPERTTFTYTKPLLMWSGEVPRELNRLDIQNWTPTPPAVEQWLISRLEEAAGRLDALLVMEQVERPGVGAITPAVRSALARLGEARRPKVILADSRQFAGEFRSVSLKVNRAELLRRFGRAENDQADADPLAAEWARELGRPVFVTLGEAGIMAATPDGRVETVPGIRVEGPIDIVGAGDSVSANVALALAAGASETEAATMGNLAGSVVVRKIGTTGTASIEELRKALATGRA